MWPWLQWWWYRQYCNNNSSICLMLMMSSSFVLPRLRWETLTVTAVSLLLPGPPARTGSPPGGRRCHQLAAGGRAVRQAAGAGGGATRAGMLLAPHTPPGIMNTHPNWELDLLRDTSEGRGVTWRMAVGVTGFVVSGRPWRAAEARKCCSAKMAA